MATVFKHCIKRFHAVDETSQITDVCQTSPAEYNGHCLHTATEQVDVQQINLIDKCWLQQINLIDKCLETALLVLSIWGAHTTAPQRFITRLKALHQLGYRKWTSEVHKWCTWKDRIEQRRIEEVYKRHTEAEREMHRKSRRGVNKKCGKHGELCVCVCVCVCNEGMYRGFFNDRFPKIRAQCNKHPNTFSNYSSPYNTDCSSDPIQLF
jgi:hypothetical protein